MNVGCVIIHCVWRSPNWAGRANFSFHDKQHPTNLRSAEITTFLTYLAVERDVAASTQAHALNTLVFLYQQVLGRDPEEFADVLHAERTCKLRGLCALPFQIQSNR